MKSCIVSVKLKVFHLSVDLSKNKSFQPDIQLLTVVRWVWKIWSFRGENFETVAN